MKHLIHILLLLTLLLAFSHNASATNQARDIIIINKIEHRLNKVLLYQLDSVIYDALGKKLEFDKSSHSANWRGQISTFEVKGNKLYLNSIKTFKEHTDFNGLLDQYKDRKGRVFASWVSDTLICGTGECIYATESGFGSVHEQETELIVENGVIISSRTYFNKTNGTADLEDAIKELDKELDAKQKKFLRDSAQFVDLHFGMGMWIRNNWGLWGHSRLQKYFLKHGVWHADDMSSIIIGEYLNYLQGKHSAAGWSLLCCAMVWATVLLWVLWFWHLSMAM